MAKQVIGLRDNCGRILMPAHRVAKADFLAVQDSSIGDLVTQSVSESVTF